MSEHTEPEDRLDFDDDGLVYNTPNNYRELANDLFYDRSVIFAWTDEAGTHLDIAMALIAKQYGDLQGGMSMDTDLFVGIARHGFFGFDITNRQWKSPGYVAEKLNLGAANETTTKLAELINGVAAELLPRAGY